MRWFAVLAVATLALLMAVPGLAAVTGVTIDNPTGLPADAVITGPDSVEITIDTFYDPDAPPIIKVFELDGVGGIIHLVENIHVGGGTPWTDWHEQLLVPDGAGGWMVSPDSDNLWWGDPTRNDGEPATSNPPSNIGIDHPSDLIGFWFDCPLVPSSFITITKDILVPEGMQTFAIAEWPTVPEPSLMVVFGVGLLALLKRSK